MLYSKIADLKNSGSKIAVRQKMMYVDKFVDYAEWDSIAPVSKKEIQLHLSSLVANEVEENTNSLRFDLRMLHIELALLADTGLQAAAKYIRTVRLIAKTLLQHAGTQTAIISNGEALKELSGEEFWDDPSINKLEQYREAVRGLMMYLPKTAGVIEINVEDEVQEDPYKPDYIIDIRTYKEKVIDYLVEHEDNETVKKIKNIEPIDSNDLKELERILWNELGSEDDYHKATDIDNLAAFIRSIVGVDQHAINTKFGDFLNDNVLNSQQQEFVKAIIDYVRENGDIETSMLLETSPFDNYDILTLFGPNVQLLTDMIEKLHNSIIAA